MNATLSSEPIHFLCRDSFSMPAYFVRPAGDGRNPGILFIYEAFGLNDEMYRLANSFAKEGFAVLMPDLFSRGRWFACIRQLMADLKQESGRGVDDLLSARDWMISQSSVDAKTTAVLGLCMGGGFALLLSKTGLFQVAAPFYGQAPQSLKGACPIVGSYGDRDGVTRRDLKRLQEEVTTHNIPSDIKIYPGAGHSFMNEAPNTFLSVITKLLPSHAVHVPAAEEDARQRVIGFIRAHGESAS
jgi:carboxymethylenebutenolidase